MVEREADIASQWVWESRQLWPRKTLMDRKKRMILGHEHL